VGGAGHRGGGAEEGEAPVISRIVPLFAFICTAAVAQDRGPGVPTSRFGVYIGRGELLVNPFFAYSTDHNREYQPAQLGYGLAQDYRGRFRSSEGLVFVAYGLTDWLAVELEASSIRATLDKAPTDTSATPNRIEESGLGDVEGQVRMRLLREGGHRPEMFGFLEVTIPSQKGKVLIGNPDWDVRPGIGIVRGFAWGTVTTRVTVEYNHDDRLWDLGEFSIEYLKRLSPSWRLNLAFEGGETGAMDEWDLVAGVQWRIRDSFFLKLDNAIGLMSKSTDWAPELGVMVALPH
jgi:hypothetical protein